MSETEPDTAGLDIPRAGGRKPQNGKAIRSLREKDGWQQTVFAERVGLTQSALSNIEREKKAARISTLNRIARALHVPVGAIMRDELEDDANGGTAA
jgi:HTH-type transcriptional regulator, competence development regulator